MGSFGRRPGRPRDRALYRRTSSSEMSQSRPSFRALMRPLAIWRRTVAGDSRSLSAASVTVTAHNIRACAYIWQAKRASRMLIPRKGGSAQPRTGVSVPDGWNVTDVLRCANHRALRSQVILSIRAFNGGEGPPPVGRRGSTGSPMRNGGRGLPANSSGQHDHLRTYERRRGLGTVGWVLGGTTGAPYSLPTSARGRRRIE